MYFPLMLKVKDEPCLVVGGGRVALQKARALRRAGAAVTAVSPEFTPAFRRAGIRRIRRPFRASDVRGKVLVIAGTDRPEVNRAVYRAARAKGIPVNVVDRPELCSFIVPSILRRGPVVVAISTGGRSPSLAKSLRKQLDGLLPASLHRVAARLGAARRRILRSVAPSPERTRRLKALVRGFRLGKAEAR